MLILRDGKLRITKHSCFRRSSEERADATWTRSSDIASMTKPVLQWRRVDDDGRGQLQLIDPASKYLLS